MSTEQRPASESSRRRRTNKSNATRPAEAVGEKNDTTAEKTEQQRTKRTPRPRTDTAPVTDDLVGKTVLGRICNVVRVQPSKVPAYGFINLGENIDAEASVPRIYFKRAEFSDEAHKFPRRGYFVEFTVAKDEIGQFYATGVHLTEKGRTEADAEKAKNDAAKAARAAAAPKSENAAPEDSTENKEGDKPKSRTNKKPKKQVEYKVVKLSVTCEGGEAKEVDVKVGQSLALLKRELVKTFGTTGDYVINSVSDEHPEGVFLTVPILKTLKDGDKITFSKQPATTA